VSRFAYHHGHYDGVEREFRGFGLVEQWDTEELAALTIAGKLDDTANIDEASHVPPVLTRTWFHTGASLDGRRISRQFEDEYYAEGETRDEAGLTEEQRRALLLPDTALPRTLLLPGGQRRAWEPDAEEAREACRALRGAMLRQEVYAADGAEGEQRPYRVTEHSYAVEALQPCGANRHAVFFTHPQEVIEFNYDRKLYAVAGGRRADPRVTHTLTLAVNEFGNVLRTASVAYGRRQPDPALASADASAQTKTWVTFTDARFTNAIATPDAYRAPLACESAEWELCNVGPAAAQPGVTNLFRFDEIAAAIAAASDGVHDLPTEDVNGTGTAGPAPHRRLLRSSRTLYRPDDLGALAGDADALLPLGVVEPMAFNGEAYELALTPGVVQHVYGSRVTDTVLAAEARYVHAAGDAGWWTASGRVFLSPGVTDSPVAEVAHAREHFFIPVRFRTAFGQTTVVRRDPYDLLPVETEDALGNRVSAGERDASGNLVAPGNDYRVLQPVLVTDPNGNRSAVAIDALGLVVGTALMGKAGGGAGDSLDGFDPDPDEATLVAALADPLAAGAALLASATTRVLYDPHAYSRSLASGEVRPTVMHTLSRERHVSELAPGEQARVRHQRTYMDGLGREIQKKMQAEPATPGGTPRWVGTGWTIFDNKGRPVRQYEPFFDDTHEFRFGVTVGVSPILFRDPVGRLVATLHPHRAWSKVAAEPWRRETWDEVDTALLDPVADGDAGDFFRRLPSPAYEPGWHEARASGQLGQAAQAAAAQTAVHAGTPAVAQLDALGRAFMTTSHNRYHDGAGIVEELHTTRVRHDVQSREIEIRDANDRTCARYDYDLLGGRIRERSMDAGERVHLSDAAGRPLRMWDARGHATRTTHDALGRATHRYVSTNGAPEQLVERVIYGEELGAADSAARNLRGSVFRTYDAAGVVTNERSDFKGNQLEGTRRLAIDFRQRPDWSVLEGLTGVQQMAAAAEPLLDPETFVITTAFDALNRPTALTTPDGSVLEPTWNEANLLETVSVRLRGSTTSTPIVTGVEYDARGKRIGIRYGNGASTAYSWDSETSRLVRLLTTRPAAGPLQDLRYTHDPLGSITEVADGAQQTVFFNNAVVSADRRYTYDALYRLIAAEGREHIGQTANDLPVHRPELKPHYDFNCATRSGLAHPHDGQAMRQYLERYRYDGVGNLLAIRHVATGGSWTREYAYAPDSNRLLATSLPGDASGGPYSAAYTHDAHGNVTSMPHLPSIGWTAEDRMASANLDGGGTVYFVYDSAGQRVRKVHEHANSTIDERIYLSGFEVYRRRQGGTLQSERETVHILDDQRRVAVVETLTTDAGAPVSVPAPLIRYQLDNHLGSSMLELDGGAQVISYEEYHPYGTTAYQAGPSAAEVSLKRYRFMGKERDAETGCYDFGARSYAPWLGRWLSADPMGMVDGPNLFAFARCRPTVLTDPKGTNTPSTATDRTIMMMTDPQLHAHLKAMTPEARASFAGGATGAFSTRAWAMLNRYSMDIAYTLPEVKITGKAPKPPPAPSPTPPGPAPLPNVKHTEAWTPPPVIRQEWERHIDMAADASNPWYTRAQGFIGATLGYLPTAGEVIVHGIIAAPQLAVTEAIAAGEHGARAYLLSEEGADEAALDEVLATAQAGFESLANAASTYLLAEGGVRAVRTKMSTPAPAKPPAVDPHAPTQYPPPQRPAVRPPPPDPYAPGTEPVPGLPPPSGPSPPPPSTPPPRPADPIGPTETPGPWAPDIPPGHYTPGFDPRKPRIPKPPRLPSEFDPSKKGS
jgi:RHS repeat-associated protein